MNPRTVRTTESLCPTCLRKIPAELFEEHGKINIKKTCREHGISRTSTGGILSITNGLWDFRMMEMALKIPEQKEKKAVHLTAVSAMSTKPIQFLA